MSPESEPQGNFIVLNDLRLHYLDWGHDSAPPAVLLHGLSSHAHVWEPLAAVLRPRFRVLALDQRGHGDSQWAGPYVTENYVADLEAFADALALSPMLLIGHSMGARNAWVYATRHPQRVERLVIVDIGPEVMRAGIERMRLSTAAPDEFDRPQDALQMMRLANARASDEALRLRVYNNLRRLPGGRWTWKYDKALRDFRRATAAGLPTSDMWALLAHIRCPTLIIRGSESDVLAADAAERMAQIIPQATLTTIEGAGHSVPADQPAAFEEAVRRFVGL